MLFLDEDFWYEHERTDYGLCWRYPVYVNAVCSRLVLLGGVLMLMGENILHELEALISEISDPVQLRTLDRVVGEIKRLQEIIAARGWSRTAVERRTKK